MRLGKWGCDSRLTLLAKSNWGETELGENEGDSEIPRSIATPKTFEITGTLGHWDRRLIGPDKNQFCPSVLSRPVFSKVFLYTDFIHTPFFIYTHHLYPLFYTHHLYLLYILSYISHIIYWDTGTEKRKGL
jgi:hypothetical protein